MEQADIINTESMSRKDLLRAADARLIIDYLQSIEPADLYRCAEEASPWNAVEIVMDVPTL